MAKLPPVNSGLAAVMKELDKQIAKGYTNGYDVANNYSGQLLEAARKLTEPKILLVDIDEVPKGWDEKYFIMLCFRPLQERIIIASALLIKEAERRQCEAFFTEIDKQQIDNQLN